MKKDLLNKKDIKKLVHSFFEKAKHDKILEHFFNNVNFNEKKHIAFFKKIHIACIFCFL